MPKLLVFASGSAEVGGSGFENLVNATRDGRLKAEIVGVVSNHEWGGVRERADRLVIPFIHFPKPYTAEAYQKIAADSGAEFFALSGWLKLVCGLDPATPFNSRTVFNIHPGLLPQYGGPGMYGHYVHEKVLADYRKGIIQDAGVSMHFVTEKYDEGPVFFKLVLPIPYTLSKKDEEAVHELQQYVNTAEHRWQPYITNLVVKGEIRWDGEDPSTLVRPDYELA